MKTLTLRFAKLSEASDIQRIFIDSDINWSESMIMDCFSADHQIVVLCDCDHVIGVLIVRVITKDIWEILQIAVDKQYLRKGCASRLLDFLLEKARSENVEKIELEVRAQNSAAIMLYKKFGFKSVGMRKQYYQNGDDAILMDFWCVK